MKGVILAAGKGSRLYPVTRHIPKPILPLANRATIEYAFDRLKEMGIRQICIVVGENESQMREALGDGERYGVELAYVRQPEPLGLAHAVGFTKDWVGADDFVLYLGDAIFGEGFASHAEKFRESGCANLNIVKPVPDPERFGVANVEGDRIVKLVEKPKQPESKLAMAGMYFFSSAIWPAIAAIQPSARGEYEITDAIQWLIDQGETVLAGVYEGIWFDTGTLDSFLETSSFLVSGKSLVDPSAQVSGEVGANVVVGPGATVQCASIVDSVVLPGAHVTVSGDIRRCVLAGNVTSGQSLDAKILYGDQDS
jgi:glucose-1-phosphate thymidylyltransferase